MLRMMTDATNKNRLSIKSIENNMPIVRCDATGRTERLIFRISFRKLCQRSEMLQQSLKIRQRYSFAKTIKSIIKQIL